jgi:drug/metabolite transporter (DMT)-like permease
VSGTDSSPRRRPSPTRLTLVVGLILVIWSFNYVVAKAGFRELPPLALASFRIVVSGLTMIPILLFSLLSERRRAHMHPAPALNPLPSRSAGRDIWRFAYLGFFGVVVNNGCFALGLYYTSVSHSSIIVGATPIVVLLLAWGLGLERITSRELAGLAVAFAGAVVLGTGHGWSAGDTALQGDLLTIAGVVGFSLYTVLGKRVAAEYSAVRMTVYNNFWGAAILLPLAVWQAVSISHSVGLSSIRWEGWAAVLYMGVLASAVSFILYFWALQSMAASQLASLNYLQPVGATLLAALLLGEKLTPNLVAGGVLVLVGVYAVESRSIARSEVST